MKTEIKKLVLEISLIVIFLIVSMPIFLNNNIKKQEKLLLSMNSLQVEKDASHLYKLSSDDELSKIPNENILITNNYVKTDYELYLVYNKNSSTDINNLKIRLNDNIYYLKDLYSNEDNEYIYYLINKDSIVKEKKLSFNIWLEETTNSNSYINYLLFIKNI